MLALCVFPYLINYMTTGSVSEKPIEVVNAPDSFIEYLDKTEGTTIYTYKFIDLDDFTEIWDSGKAIKNLKSGTLYVFFDDEENSVYVACNGNSSISMTRAESFIEVVMNAYNDDLREQGTVVYEVDTFNPVTKLLDYRSEANFGAARVIPPVLILLVYYCIYSLTSDMFASERDRGFYDKLLMTPVSPIQIMMGKILACTGLVTVASYVTFLFLFISSWINRSNSSASLIPFGLFLLPDQLLIIAIVIPVTAFFCAIICVDIIFSIRQMKDVVLNLQMPLIYLMADLFFQIFSATPGWVEFAIPIHGSICVIKTVFLSEFRLWQLIVLLIFTLIPALLMLRRIFKKEGYIH